MAQLATGEPVWDLPFDEKGSLTGSTVDDFVGKVRRQCVDDLFVFCHGWNTSQDDARALYDTMFPMIRDAARVSQNLGNWGSPGSTGPHCGSRPHRPPCLRQPDPRRPSPAPPRPTSAPGRRR